MELDEVARLKEPLPEYSDMTPRRKCSVCCAARCAVLASVVTFLVSFPFQLVALDGRVCEGRGWRGFCNRHLYLPLPVAVVTFTHHYLLSEALWSRRCKTLQEISTPTTVIHCILSCMAVGASTALSRRYLPRYSAAYRLRLWEYQRRARASANAYTPTLLGRLTHDLDWITVLSVVAFYHALWSAYMAYSIYNARAHYAVPFDDTWYSAWCSPRWREWREVQVQRHVYTTQQTGRSRWPNFLMGLSEVPRR